VTPCPKLWLPNHEGVIFGCIKAETIAAGGARPGRKPDEDRQFQLLESADMNQRIASAHQSSWSVGEHDRQHRRSATG